MVAPLRASAIPEDFSAAYDRLHEAVAAALGGADFGAPDYQAGLRVLLDSMTYDVNFTPRGREIAWGQVSEVLASRAIAFRSMAENPGFDRHAIRKPVVITGVPRTGSTALHKLLAVDPQFQGPEKWLLSAPKPRPPRDTWERDPAFQQDLERMRVRYAETPQLRAAHELVAEDVEECLWIQRQSFVSNFWTCSWSSASYDAWWRSEGEHASYQYLYRVLQLIGHREPDRRWLLKNPSHILHLDRLFEVMPDAKVIQTHRDPAKAVPSLCALLMQVFPLVEIGRADLRARLLGARETGKWAKAVADAQVLRRSHGGQILDVVHEDFHADPIGVVRRIYRFLDLELASDVAQAMERRAQAAPELRHGAHRYRAEDFGLREDEIRERFGDYIGRFSLRPAAS